MEKLEIRLDLKTNSRLDKLIQQFGLFGAVARETGAQFIDRLKAIVDEIELLDPEQKPTDKTIVSKIMNGIIKSFPFLYGALTASERIIPLQELMTKVAANEAPNLLVDAPGSTSNSPLDPAGVVNFLKERHKKKNNGSNWRAKLLEKKDKKERVRVDEKPEHVKRCYECDSPDHLSFDCPIILSRKRS